MTTEVKKYYNRNCEKEESRLSSNSMEYLMTNELLDRYIKNGDRVLDLGGGTGIYAIPLCKKQCNVKIVDLAEKELEIASRKAAVEGVGLTCVRGDAKHYNDANTYDAIMCLGPLYHCRSEKEIRQIIENCIKLLRPGGIGFFSFISVYAKFNRFVQNIDRYNNEDIVKIKKFWDDRSNITSPFVFESRNELPINFAYPEQLYNYLHDFDIMLQDVLSVDIVSSITHCSLSQSLFELMYALGSSYMINQGEHIIVSFRKR